MAATVKAIREWLAQFNDDVLVGVDDGGLTLQVVDDDRFGLKIQPYFELGGLPLDEEEG